MTVRKNKRSLTSPEEVAQRIPGHEFPIEAPFEEWFEEVRYYASKLAGNTEHGFVCRTAVAAGVGLGDWFRKQFKMLDHR